MHGADWRSAPVPRILRVMNKRLLIATLGLGAKALALTFVAPHAITAGLFSGILAVLVAAVVSLRLDELPPAGAGSTVPRMLLDGVGAGLIAAMVWLKLGDGALGGWLPALCLCAALTWGAFASRGRRGALNRLKAAAVPALVVGLAGLTVPLFQAGALPPSQLSTSHVLLTLAAGVTACAMLLADFNGSHLENPRWPAHARFHSLWFILFTSSIGLFSLYLLWHPPFSIAQTNALVAALQVITWAPVLLAWGAPRTSIWPDGLTTRAPINGNIVLAVAVLGLCGAGWSIR